MQQLMSAERHPCFAHKCDCHDRGQVCIADIYTEAECGFRRTPRRSFAAEAAERRIWDRLTARGLTGDCDIF